MVSAKVDLTENRDFSGGWGNIFAMDLPVGEMFARETPSLEEHERYIESVKMFGLKYHMDRSYDIFGFKSVRGINGTCVTCKKPILPWKQDIYSNTQLCDECRRNTKQRPPWKPVVLINLNNPRPEATNLFGLR